MHPTSSQGTLQQQVSVETSVPVIRGANSPTSMQTLPVIRGANSDILSTRIVEKMARRRPDLIRAEVPGRAHMPFLDEPESLAALRGFLAAVEATYEN